MFSKLMEPENFPVRDAKKAKARDLAKNLTGKFINHAKFNVFNLIRRPELTFPAAAGDRAERLAAGSRGRGFSKYS